MWEERKYWWMYIKIIQEILYRNIKKMFCQSTSSRAGVVCVERKKIGGRMMLAERQGNNQVYQVTVVIPVISHDMILYLPSRTRHLVGWERWMIRARVYMCIYIYMCVYTCMCMWPAQRDMSCGLLEMTASPVAAFITSMPAHSILLVGCRNFTYNPVHKVLGLTMTNEWERKGERKNK